MHFLVDQNQAFLVVLGPHQGGSATFTCCREYLRVSCQGQSPSLYFLFGIIIFSGFDS